MKYIDKNKSEHGAALIELAIVLPFLLLLLMGIIEIGLLFYNQQILTNSSREGARAAIARIDINGNTLDAAAIEGIVEDYLGLGATYTDRRLITFGSDPDPDVTTTGLGGAFGEDLTVAVEYDHPFLIPGLLNLGASIHLKAQTVMRMERVIAPTP